MNWKPWLAGVVLLAGWAQAQESCHWNNVQQRYYRMRGSTNSLIETIFFTDGAFAISHEDVGGVIVLEAAMDMMRSNWISQEHHRMMVMGEFQLIEPTDPSRIPRTGQRWTYHDGDDGDLQPGHSWPPRFTVPEVNTNVVVDNLTGLMWMRFASPIYGAWDFCLDMVSALDGIYDYNGWRMPTVREMESLIDLGAYNPALPGLHPFVNVTTHYWTSTGNINNTNHAWKISVVDGAIHSWARSNDVPYCWPVRTHTFGPSPVPKTGMTTSLRAGDDGDLQPGQLWPIPRFTIQSDTNLVFDNLWGRMWTRADGIDTADAWWLAVQQCNEFELGGYRDWRLPTRREGWSLLDYGRPSFLPEGHPFTGAPPSPIYWTSTSYHGIEPENWGWGISGGAVSPAPKGTAGGAVWPVRGDW